jgi:hypothetical protein
MTMTNNKRHNPVDYTAQNAREFNALRGVELLDATVNRDGELVVVFDVSTSDATSADERIRSFVDVLLPADEDPETVKIDELLGDVVSMPDSKVLPIRGLSED